MEEIVIKKEFDAEVANQQKSFNKAQFYLEGLKRLGDIPCNCLEDLAEGNIEAFIAKKVEAVSSAEFLTEDNKTLLLQDWKAKKAKALAYIREIVAVVENTPEATFSIKDGFFTCNKTIEELAKAKCRRPIPNEAFKHYELLCEYRKAANALKEFEAQNDCRHIDKSALMTITRERICEGWADGTIKIDHTYDALYKRAQSK